MSNVSFSQCKFEQGPIGEICSKAYYICGSELDGYKGKLRIENSTKVIWPDNAPPPAFSQNQGVCNREGTFDNTTWFSFTACSEKVHLRITFNSCAHPTGNLSQTGIQTGLYSECKKSSSEACAEFQGGLSGVLDLSYNNFVPGNLVYFVLDGWAASICEFEIEVVEGIDTTLIVPPTKSGLNDGFITGNNKINCSELNSPITYNLTPPDCAFVYNNACAPIDTKINPQDSICYVWQVTPVDGRSFVQADSVGRDVAIAFTKPGIYTISAEGFLHPFYGGSCANGICGEINTWQVEVLSPTEIINPEIVTCPDVPFDYCNQYITRDTTIRCQQDDCTFITQSIVFSTSKLNLIGSQYLCSGTTFDFQGQAYSIPGDYEVIDQTDCSLVHKFKIEALALDANINSSAIQITCNQQSINLSAIGITNTNYPLSYSWFNTAGVPIGTTNNLSITDAGVYKMICEVKVGASTCSVEKSITITKDVKEPIITLDIPKLRCLLASEKKPELSFVSTDVFASIVWTSPLGNKTNNSKIALDSLNVATNRPYSLNLVGINGCKKDTSITIKSDFSKADVTLESDIINCRKPKTTITLRTSLPIDSLRWYQTAPSLAFYGSFRSNMSIDVDVPGIYQAQVMASASKCWSNGSTEIFADRKIPELDLGNDLIWNCNTKSLDITPQVATGTDINYKWASIDGKFNSADNVQNATVTSPGTYWMEVENLINGCFRKDTILVAQETNIPTSIYYQSFNPSCYQSKDASIVVSGIEGGFGPYSYFLNDLPITIEQLDNLIAGDYVLKVRDKNGCTEEQLITIIQPLEVEVELPQYFGIDFTEELVLTAKSNFDQSEIASYLWKDSKGNILSREEELILFGEQSVFIDLEIMTINGCIARTSTSIEVDNELKIYFPNVFSPNGDGNNDIFFIGKNKIPASLGKMTFYDRLGNMVFNVENAEFGNPDYGWNGMFKGQYVTPGVYVYIIEYTDYFGKKHFAKKDLTILR